MNKKVEINFSNLKNNELSTEVVKKNEAFLTQLEEERRMDDKSDLLKEAIREDNYSEVIEHTDKEEQVVEGEEHMTSATMKRYVSLKFGVIGAGQAGGRIAEVFYKRGYDAVAINTARQDLEFVDIPEENKLFIGDEHLGGAGRDLEFGLAAAEEHEEQIRDFLDNELGEADILILAFSGGGGTGAGSSELLVEILADMGRPVIVIYALPGSYDDPQSKHNAIQTLAKLADAAQKEVINSLVLVDNAKIELAYPDASQAAFWKIANEGVVEPLHMFNQVSAMPTDYEALDSMDFAKVFLEAGNCAVFGSNKISAEWYEDDEAALVSAIVENLDHGLLAGGFSLNEAQNVGVLITARQSVLEKIPYSSIAYVFKYISEEYDSAKSFKGVYAVPSDDDDITVHFIFSGLGLPKERVESLKLESEKHMKKLSEKKRTTNMGVGLSKDKTTSKADRVMNKIKKKNSAVGKLRNRKRPRRR